MKFWIYHSPRTTYQSSYRIEHWTSLNEDEALKHAMEHNRYLMNGELPFSHIQSIEIETDRMLGMMLNEVNLISWQQNIFKLLEAKDNAFKFGILIKVPEVQHIVLD